MIIHRALRASLASLFVMGTCLVPWRGPASAQEASVQLTLISQTPITTPGDPLLQITVQATNGGDAAFDILSLGISIGTEINSRFVYEQSLESGPGSTLICCTSRPQEGTLEPGQSRSFDVSLNMVEEVPTIGVTEDSAVYAAQIDIRSDGVVQAALNTALIHLVRTPERPMLLSWWTEITGSIAFGPDGRLSDRSFEASVAPVGTLGMQTAALQRLVDDPGVQSPLDVALEPALLDQLERMTEGYERSDGSVVAPDQLPATDAGTVLQTLRAVAADPEVQIAAMPFSAPLMPAMLAGGLSGDLDGQRALGDQTVEDLLGQSPVTSFERPPSGAIDDATLDDLAIRGVGAVLANADAVDRVAQLNDFAPLPAAAFTLPSGSSLDLVLPDPGVQALLVDPVLMSDPVRAAQAVLGELATIWREQPVPADQADGTETVRGVAVALSASLPPAMWVPMTRRLVDASFLVPTHAQDFVERVNPLQPADVLAAPSLARFDRTYVDQIRDERRDIDAYDSMLAEPSTTPDRLRTDLLYAEAGVYIDDAELSGRRWIDHVNALTNEVFDRALPAEAQAFTLTSGQGQVPLRMGDPGETPLIVQIQLRSSQFDFPDGNEQTVTLREPDQIVTFTVKAKTSGTQTIRMKTRAPSGRPLDERNLAVRTTAVNSIALVITGAAGLLLVALWCRRYIRRPRS